VGGWVGGWKGGREEGWVGGRDRRKRGWTDETARDTTTDTPSRQHEVAVGVDVPRLPVRLGGKRHEGNAATARRVDGVVGVDLVLLDPPATAGATAAAVAAAAVVVVVVDSIDPGLDEFSFHGAGSAGLGTAGREVGVVDTGTPPSILGVGAGRRRAVGGGRAVAAVVVLGGAFVVGGNSAAAEDGLGARCLPGQRRSDNFIVHCLTGD